jgi:hypothetical protein
LTKFRIFGETVEPRLERNPPPAASNLGESDRRRGGEVLVPDATQADLVPWLESELAYLGRLDLRDAETNI